MSEQEFILDFSNDEPENTAKGINNEENSDNIIDRIHKSDLEPLFDTNHVHNFVKDSEETDEYFVEVCNVGKCGMGRMVAKT